MAKPFASLLGEMFACLCLCHNGFIEKHLFSIINVFWCRLGDRLYRCICCLRIVVRLWKKWNRTKEERGDQVSRPETDRAIGRINQVAVVCKARLHRGSERPDLKLFPLFPYLCTSVLPTHKWIIGQTREIMRIPRNGPFMLFLNDLFALFEHSQQGVKCEMWLLSRISARMPYVHVWCNSLTSVSLACTCAFDVCMCLSIYSH